MLNLKYSNLSDDSFYKCIECYRMAFILKIIKIMIIYKRLFYTNETNEKIKSLAERLQKEIRDHNIYFPQQKVEIDFNFSTLYIEDKPVSFKKVFFKSVKNLLSKRAIFNPFSICQIKISNLFPKELDANIELKNNLINKAFLGLCEIFDLDLSCENIISYDDNNRPVEISFYPISKIYLDLSSTTCEDFDLNFNIGCKVLMNDYETSLFQNKFDYPNYKDFIKKFKKYYKNFKVIQYKKNKAMNKI